MITDKAQKYAQIFIDGDVISEDKKHLVAANIQQILESEAALVRAFCDRFDEWIMKQLGDVQWDAAMAFGEEYKTMRDSIAVEEEASQ